MATNNLGDLTVVDDYSNNRKQFRLDIDTFRFAAEESIHREIVEIIARAVAEEFLKDNYKKIVEKLSPEAIANMAIAEAAAQVNETLGKKLPDKIVETVKQEVYQKSFFGGLKRIG